MSTTLSRDNWRVSLSWRYIHEMDVFDPDDFNTDVDAVNYFDFFGAYTFDHFEVSVGVENLADEEPPFIPGVSQNSSPYYDYLGRFYYARLKYSM